MKQKETINELELLKMEKLDTDYLEERLEYKRFLEELVKTFSSYFYRINNYYMNNENTEQFSFTTYRYNQIKPYLENFLKSYNLGRIVTVKNISKAYPEAKEIKIEFNCFFQDLVKAMWSEVQMLEYCTKSTKEVESDYLSFIRRDEERYKPLLNREACNYYFHNYAYFNQKFLGYIPENILYRIITMLEKNYYFKDKKGMYQRSEYVKGLKDLGLSREYIAELTGYTPEMMDEYYPNIPKNR